MNQPARPRRLTRFLRRRWGVLATGTVLAAGAAAVTALIVDVDDPAVTIALAAAGGFVVALVVALVAGALERTVSDPARLERLTKVPNLAVVPRHALGAARPDDVAMLRRPDSVEAEGYRSLRTALEFVLSDRIRLGEPGDENDGAGHVVLVTSPRPGEGKSSVAANLAVASAMAGRRVVLVDADLRKPQVHRLFGCANEVGLASVLAGEARVADAVQRLDELVRLALLTSGPPPPDPAEVLANGRLHLMLRSLSAAADLVVIDAPPLLAVTDPTIVSQSCTAVVTVATAGMSTRREHAEAVRRLAVVDAPVVGSVLLSPDDRVQAVPSYRYAPSARPDDWWVTDASSSTRRTRHEAQPTEDDDEGAAPDIWSESGDVPRT